MGRWLAATSLALGLAAPGAIPAQEAALRFARHGEELARLGRDGLDARAEARTLRVFEPYEGREVEFRAWPLGALLDGVFGPGWRTEDEILFRCRDGYQPSVPVARFLRHDAYLAFARPGAPGFSIRKRESGRLRQVRLGPYYVVWDNLEDAALRRDGDYGWPYQVTGLELVRASERFPAMAPPAHAPEAAQQGFRDFRIHCSRCHRLNGVGGSIGPELNARPDPAGLRDPAWLRRWIDDPASFNATARMPALNPALPDREATVGRIVAYLRAVATARAP